MKLKPLLILSSILLIGTVRGMAVLVTAPFGSANTEGNSYIAPLNTGPFAARFQQVYSSSLFSALPPGGGRILEITFRTDTMIGQNFNSTLPNLQVNFSTTSRNPDGLSAVFADNVGPDNKLVFGGPLHLDGAHFPSISPQLFDIVIHFPTPFFYNPANGDLLMDIRSAGGLTTYFDAVDAMPDSVSSVFDSGTSLQVTSRGLVTRFAIEVVPEPSSVWLLAAGLVLLGFLIRRHRRSKRARELQA